MHKPWAMRKQNHVLYDRPYQMLVMDTCVLTGTALCELEAGVIQVDQCRHVTTLSALIKTATLLPWRQSMVITELLSAT